jgi:hypothetical protein
MRAQSAQLGDIKELRSATMTARFVEVLPKLFVGLL